MHTLDVGAKKQIEHTVLQVKLQSGGICDGCEFYGNDMLCHIGSLREILGACSAFGRSDHYSVIFAKVTDCK